MYVKCPLCGWNPKAVWAVVDTYGTVFGIFKSRIDAVYEANYIRQEDGQIQLNIIETEIRE